MSETNAKVVCMDAAEIERSLTRIAHQILESNKGLKNVALVGIVTRGDMLAKRLVQKLEQIEGVKVLLVHGSPRKNNEDILPGMKMSEILEIIQGETSDLILCGHTHVPCNSVPAHP